MLSAARLGHFLRELLADVPGGGREKVGIAFRELLLNGLDDAGHFDRQLPVDVYC
jgi:hypothetical protein